MKTYASLFMVLSALSVFASPARSAEGPTAPAASANFQCGGISAEGKVITLKTIQSDSTHASIQVSIGESYDYMHDRLISENQILPGQAEISSSRGSLEYVVDADNEITVSIGDRLPGSFYVGDHQIYGGHAKFKFTYNQETRDYVVNSLACSVIGASGY